MIKPDVIVVWPRNCDYPLWRQQIRNSRKFFTDVIVVFMETNTGSDYREFVQEAMKDDQVKFFQSPPVIGDKDWRDVATNEGLKHSFSKWVYFTEQDFFTTMQFWQEVNLRVRDHYPVIGVMEGDRLHPCSFLCRRESIERTRKDFGIVAGQHDHFWKFTQDLVTNVEEIAVVKGGYEHMNGLSHNLSLLEQGKEITYKPEVFRKYLEKCLKVEVPMHDNFREMAEKYVG